MRILKKGELEHSTNHVISEVKVPVKISLCNNQVERAGRRKFRDLHLEAVNQKGSTDTY